MRISAAIVIFMLFVSVTSFAQSPLFQYDNNVKSSSWSSPENKNGVKGYGAKENGGAKGHAFDVIDAGASLELLNVQGTGMITRIWVTIDDRTPEMMRSLRFEIFWDNETKPAVAAPLGDFFSTALSRTATFQNSLFASPEGRSFVCLIPMPFKKGARVVLTNQSAKRLTHIFYDVDFQFRNTWNENDLYFHAHWRRDTATVVGKDFELLPGITGKGRYLGASIGINSNPVYGTAWWGEGEVKMFLDGDSQSPTIAGTGTEDYIGTGWGQGMFVNQYSGCLIADPPKQQWAYYRYHVTDPIFFSKACRVTLQQIGGDDLSEVADMQKRKIPLSPVTLDKDGKLFPLYKKKEGQDLASAGMTDGWVNFYRSDDVSAIAYFYLDTPMNSLPELQGVGVRRHHVN